MSIDLISNDLKEYISKKVKKDINKLEEIDLLEIKKIIFRSVNNFEEQLDYNISDIEKLKNLINCTIFLFPITEKEIEDINKLQKLKFINFDSCNIKTNKLSFSENIENLFIDNCNFEEDLKISGKGLKNIKILGNPDEEPRINISNFNNIDKIENLEIHYFNILGLENILTIAPNLKKLDLDGSKIENFDNIEKFLYRLNKNIEITNKKHYFLK